MLDDVGDCGGHAPLALARLIAVQHPRERAGL
jgi:hypothetical protein